jgi:hypothetical protein
MAYINIISQEIKDVNGNLIPLRGLVNADGSVSLDTSASFSGNITLPSGTYINIGSMPNVTIGSMPAVALVSGAYVNASVALSSVSLVSGAYVNAVISSMPAVTLVSGAYVNSAVAQLPAATALVDDLSNPTTTTIGAAMKGFDGKTWDRYRIPAVIYNMNNVAIGSSGGTIATPTGSNKFRLMGGQFSVSQACSVEMFDNTTGSLMVLQSPMLDANARYAFDIGNGYLSVTGGYPLKALASVTGTTIVGYLYGTEE